MPVKNIHGMVGYQGVQLGDRVVVVLAGEGDLVLGLGQLALQVEEVRVGLEVGVGLGDGVQPDQRALQRASAAALAGTSSPGGGGLQAGPGLGDLLEDLLLVGGVPLDRVDQVGDQVGAPGELDVDAAQRLLRADVAGAQLVEARSRSRRGPTSTAITMMAMGMGATCFCGSWLDVLDGSGVGTAVGSWSRGHQEPPPPPPPPPPPEKPPPPPPLRTRTGSPGRTRSRSRRSRRSCRPSGRRVAGVEPAYRRRSTPARAARRPSRCGTSPPTGRRSRSATAHGM